MVFECSICGRPTTSRRALEDHERTHGDSRITCDYRGCQLTYKSQSALRRHFVNVHEPEIRAERERERRERRAYRAEHERQIEEENRR